MLHNNHARWALALAGITFSATARADFVPGRVYISDGAQKNCQGPVEPDDRIWEVDPVTGSVSLFVTTPHELCGNMSGLAFKPDGSALRASVFLTSSILEIDGNASVSVALDSADGIAGPHGYNNIAYDPQGNFYVHNINDLLRYPADGGPPALLAQFGTFGPIDVAPDGDVYFGGFDTIFRISPAGDVEPLFTFTTLGDIFSLTVDSQENIFVSFAGSIYRFDHSNPSSAQVLAPAFGSFTSLTMSPTESAVYAFKPGQLYAIDASSGSTTLITDQAPLTVGGLAVAVPEPNTAVILLVGTGFVARRRGHTRRAGTLPRFASNK
jgi:hypothetical protein